MQDNDGLSWHASGNANMEKQQFVNLEGIFKVLPQWIWMWCKKMKYKKMN